jgi:cytochrome P450
MDQAVSAPQAERPAHVPEHLVFPFDYNLDAGLKTDPQQRAAELAAAAPPIFWTPYNRGHWVVLPYEPASDALRDPDHFSSEHFPADKYEALMAQLPENQRAPAPIPICVDPPVHTGLRMPLMSIFSPKAAAAMRNDIQALADRLVDAIKPNGRCEFVREVAEPFPVEIFLKMFGMPEERAREYRDLAKELLSGLQGDMADSLRRNRKLSDLMRDTILDRRDNPKDDVISKLWQLELDGQPMTLSVMESYCVTLFLGGLDTVVNALGFGVGHLAKHPELQAELRAHPERAPNAVEELLRMYGIVSPVRLVKQALNFHGVEFKQGEIVMMFVPSIGIDAKIYENPRQVDLQRNARSHMTFATGPHFCVGAHLARLELAIMYQTMVSKLPTFRIDPDRPPAFHGGVVSGPTSLNLVW